MGTIWTLAGDEGSWAEWAENMALAPASLLMQELIAHNKTIELAWALDLGCGTGRAFNPLSDAGYRVIGVDPIRRGLRMSQERSGPGNRKPLALQASAANLPLQSSSVAFVLALGILFHLSQVELIQTLSEIRRILSPGGKALLHFLDLEDWRHTLAAEVRPAEIPVPSYRAVVTCFCSRDVIQSWIESAGLVLDSLELRSSRSEEGTQPNWLAWCRR